MEKVRIYEFPSCKMVTSQCGTFGDGKLEKFNEWFSSFPRALFPRDFLTYDNERNGLVWYYMYHDGMHVPEDFSIIDFQGGLYAVATDIDGADDSEIMGVIREFVKQKGCFEEDPSRPYFGNIPTPPSAAKALGYEQMDYYIPIRILTPQE